MMSHPKDLNLNNRFLFSPQKEDIQAKLLWSQEGRAKNVDSFVYIEHKEEVTPVPSETKMQYLASLLFNRQEQEAAGEETLQRDPLDELLSKDFQKLSASKPGKS
jgi:hypothetical protein